MTMRIRSPQRGEEEQSDGVVVGQVARHHSVSVSLLPVMRREKGTMGVVVRVGGFAHPHHLPLLIPPPHAAEQRVEGARGWDFTRLTVRLSNYLFRFTC
jgi:hypothetical protein